jgi:parallel beta-helix repeat protein
MYQGRTIRSMRHTILVKGATIGVVLLLLGTTSVLSNARKMNSQTPPTKGGNIFYVGGLGPNNYTTIQSAIDAASNGDTIFVYHDSSPYYEHVEINKSISLLGEDTQTTELNGSFLTNSLDTMLVTSDHVTINGFTITDNQGYYYQGAIKITGEYITISNCTITHNEWIGIYLLDASFCHIIECELSNNLVAIDLVASAYNIIQNCVCDTNAEGITLYQSSDDNQIINCLCNQNSYSGIHIQQSKQNQLIDCICQNGYGISLSYAPQTKMRNTTLLNNYANFGIGSPYVSDFYCDIDTSNTINGKPLYYLIGQHNLSFNETTPVGFLGLVDCENISVKNLIFTNNFEGMLLAGSSHSLIENCSFNTNDGHGMYIISSQHNTVSTCMFQNSFFDGVYLYNSAYNTIQNCSYDNSVAGVRLEYSTDTSLKDQRIDNCMIGVLFESASRNIMRNNEILQCGIQVTGSSSQDYINDVDISNTVNAKPVYYLINETNSTIPSDAGQVILINSHGCTVSNLSISDASIGIELAYSSMNTLAHNTLLGNSVVAIDLDGAQNNGTVIKENTLTSNNYGIDVDISSTILIQDNLLSDNGVGISLDQDSGIILTGNTIKNGSYGIVCDHSWYNTATDNTIDSPTMCALYLFSSAENILKSTKMTNCSLMVYGNTLADYINDVDTSNTVNGKPIYYRLHQTQQTIPSDAGEVLLIDSQGCTVENLNLNQGSIGMTLAYSSQNIIRGNTIRNQSMIAIDLGAPGNNDNILFGNILQDNGYGIDIEGSKGNTLQKNTVSSNVYGIYLYNAVNTTLRRNSILRNNLGIDAIQSPGSLISFNNIFWNYIYGLSADACLVSARWNWWGAARGPQSIGNGNGDRIRSIKDGMISYRPWRLLPVFFTGIVRMLLSNPKPTDIIDNSFTSQRNIFSELNHTFSETTDRLNIRTSVIKTSELFHDLNE